jgi:hypothetical protein
VLVIGDSVMWGQYVSARETLPQWLNGLAGADRFANLGVNGTYPVALAGLVEHYGHAIAGKSVLLFCNPLWMSSDKYDLKDAKEVGYHPRLVPQFFPRIPAYHESFDGKLGVVIQRNIALVDWVNHLRMAYFESTDIAKWTQDHPYANPLRAITLELPLSQDPAPGAETRLWTGQDDERYNPLWVDLQGSLQWAAFRRTIEILQGRGNRVFVLVGPFNEHMLKSPSLATYQEMKKGVAAWLEEKRIVYYVPPALPSELYADASHPLAAGYQRLARQLWEDKAFLEFVRGD